MSNAIAIRGAVGALLLVTFAACGGDGTPGITDPKPKPADTLNRTAIVSALLSEITKGQAAVSASLVAGGVPAAPAPVGSSYARSARSALLSAAAGAAPDDAGQCVFETTGVRFVCPTITQPNGLVTTLYFQLLDAANTPQAEFDTATTVAVKRVSDRSGVISNPLITMTGPVPAIDTINNHEEMVLSGIKTSSRRLNGTGLMKVVIVPEGQPVVSITAPTTTADLSFFQDTTKRYPITGTVTATVSSIRGGTPPSTSTTTQVTTYDGTTIATLVITFVSGQKRTCTYDMTLANVPATCTGP